MWLVSFPHAQATRGSRVTGALNQGLSAGLGLAMARSRETWRHARGLPADWSRARVRRRFDNRTSHCNRGGVSLTSFDRNRHFNAHHIPPEMETARWSDISFECQSHTIEPDEYKRINLKIGGWLVSLAYIWPEQPTTLSRRKPISPPAIASSVVVHI